VPPLRIKLVLGGTTKNLRTLTQSWPCELCDESIGSKQALAVHMCKKRNHKRHERQLIEGTICESCLVDFHTRTLLMCHICEKTELCRAIYWELEQRIDTVEADRLDSLERERIRKDRHNGNRHHKAHVACIRHEGPFIKQMAGFLVSKWPSFGIGKRRLAWVCKRNLN